MQKEDILSFLEGNKMKYLFRSHSARIKLKSFCIAELIAESEYVQEKCVNEVHPHELFGEVWTHTLPLKEKEKHFLDPSNWDLPETEIEKIQGINKKLNDYALVVFDFVYGGSKIPLKEALSSVTDLLPPWIVFPLYTVSCMGWRMGNGEEYQDVYVNFIHSLTEEEFERYNEAYPVPEYIKVRFGSIRQMAGEEKEKDYG